MSKDDKDLAENEGVTDLATDSAIPDGTGTPALPVSAHEPEQKKEQALDQSEQSRLFNSWLDRALPRLMQYLGDDTTSAVTSPGDKAKH